MSHSETLEERLRRVFWENYKRAEEWEKSKVEREETILKYHSEGLTNFQISRASGISKSMVHTILKQHGLRANSKPRPKADTEARLVEAERRREEYVRLLEESRRPSWVADFYRFYNEGMNDKQISELIGVPSSTISNYRRKRGLKARSTRRRKRHISNEETELLSQLRSGSK